MKNSKNRSFLVCRTFSGPQFTFMGKLNERLVRSGNLYAGGRLLYHLCNCRIGCWLIGNYFFVVNNQAHSWLSTAQTITNSIVNFPPYHQKGERNKHSKREREREKKINSNFLRVFILIDRVFDYQ